MNGYFHKMKLYICTIFLAVFMGPESPRDLSQAAMGSRSVFRQPSIDDMARLLTGLVGIAPESAMTTKRRDHLFAVNVRRLLAAGRYFKTSKAAGGFAS